jgi:hypothetical protein
MIYSGAQVKPMKITEMRISFVQVETLGNLLRSRKPPTTPLRFLLNSSLFADQYQRPAGQVDVPWTANGYAPHFWNYYAPDPNDFKQHWRALVPLEYKLAVSLLPTWSGDAIARAYVYPWGIGLLLEISLKGDWEEDAAVDKALDVRRNGVAGLQPPDPFGNQLLNNLIQSFLDRIRQAAYGDGTQPGARSELFTIATVMEGSGAANVAITSGTVEHQRLEALAGWNTQWRQLNKLKPLSDNPPSDNTIRIKDPAPVSHIVYAKSRGRTVWFPQYFKSITKDDRLLIYHQNLTMAALQTESLCQLANDVARQIVNNQPQAHWSYCYSDCAQFAAGLLGRLCGGKQNTYRSDSLRHQIKTTYEESVNSLRAHFEMPNLT